MSMSKKTKIAVYGTLRRGYGNHRRVATSTLVGEGLTKEKYTMYASGIPFVDKKPTCQIRVEIYEVTPEVLKSVDSLEGHPYAYKREPIPIEMDNGDKLDAELYFYPVDPERSYLTEVVSGDYNDYRNARSY